MAVAGLAAVGLEEVDLGAAATGLEEAGWVVVATGLEVAGWVVVGTGFEEVGWVVAATGLTVRATRASASHTPALVKQGGGCHRRRG